MSHMSYRLGRITHYIRPWFPVPMKAISPSHTAHSCVHFHRSLFNSPLNHKQLWGTFYKRENLSLSDIKQSPKSTQPVWHVGLLTCVMDPYYASLFGMTLHSRHYVGCLARSWLPHHYGNLWGKNWRTLRFREAEFLVHCHRAVSSSLRIAATSTRARTALQCLCHVL